MDKQTLMQHAIKACQNAYAPYSGYRVGAAVLCQDGSVFTGVNVENASYGLTVCAERNAIFTAVGAGNRAFKAIAVYVDSLEPFPPCGACRQVLAEFGPELAVYWQSQNGQLHSSSIKELLPESFSLSK